MPLYVDIRKNLGDFTLETRFEAAKGVTGILGASGCGKSMTLRCIAGILRPDQGRIELDGTVLFDSEKGINVKPQKRHVGLLFQNYALFPNMTVRQNLMAGLLPHEKDKKRAGTSVEDMLERFHLRGLEDHRPSQLSGGQQQRVALLRILLSRPRILMLDEPFSALDDFLRWNLELELMEVLEEYGGSVLFVSHSREEIRRLCDWVCVMDQGKSSPIIPVRQLFDAPGSKAAALLSGCKNFSRAKEAGEGRISAVDWGIELRYEGEAPKGLRYIGIQSRHIKPVLPPEASGQRENTFCCELLQIIEDVCSMVLLLRPEASGAKPSGWGERQDGQLWAEVGKESWEAFCLRKAPGRKLWVHVDRTAVLLLC